MYLTQPEWTHLHARWIQREVGFDYAHVSWNFLDFIESSCRKWHQTSNREQSSRKSDATRGLLQSAVVKSDHRRGRHQLSRQFVEATRNRAWTRAYPSLRESAYPPNRKEDSTMCENVRCATCTLNAISRYIFLSFTYVLLWNTCSDLSHGLNLIRKRADVIRKCTRVR